MRLSPIPFVSTINEFPARMDGGDERDRRYLREALREARRAARRGEVPVGAVVVVGDTIVGRGSNQPIAANDPTAHAEIVALRQAARRLENYRLSQAEVFVTVEPCLMCFGAFVHARVAAVIYGASDPKVGSLTSANDLLLELGRINHRFEVRGGVLAEEAAALLAEFFASRRQGGNEDSTQAESS